MPLIPCPDCGAEVSPRAPNCLRCGAPVAMPRAGWGRVPMTLKAGAGMLALGLVLPALSDGSGTTRLITTGAGLLLALGTVLAVGLSVIGRTGWAVGLSIALAFTALLSFTAVFEVAQRQPGVALGAGAPLAITGAALMAATIIPWATRAWRTDVKGLPE